MPYVPRAESRDSSGILINNWVIRIGPPRRCSILAEIRAICWAISKGRIRPEDYYCLDVIKDAIEEGRKQFPDAHWVHYDRYNCSFNPEGSASVLIPELGLDFDFILAYSVFTHTTRDEMHDLVGQLRTQLKPGGTLAFTYIDPHRHSWPTTYQGSNLQWRLDAIRETDPAADLSGLLEKSRGAAWVRSCGRDSPPREQQRRWQRRRSETQDLSRVLHYRVHAARVSRRDDRTASQRRNARLLHHPAAEVASLIGSTRLSCPNASYPTFRLETCRLDMPRSNVLQITVSGSTYLL